MLNQAHAEHRMLVVSHDGYPDYILPTIAQALEAQPDFLSATYTAVE